MVVVVVMKLMIAGNTLFDFSLLLRHLPFGRELKAGLAHLAAIRAKRLPRLIKFRITFWVTTHTHTHRQNFRARSFFSSPCGNYTVISTKTQRIEIRTQTHTHEQAGISFANAGMVEQQFAISVSILLRRGAIFLHLNHY